MKTLAAAPGVAVRFAGSLLLIAAGGGGAPALALPEYAQREAKSCAYCHVAENGAGARNYRGEFYRKHRRSFAGFDDAAEARKAGAEVGPDADPAPRSYAPPRRRGRPC